MNIAVMIKQVPRTEKIKIDALTGTLLRKGVESILNPYCEYALDTALMIKNRFKNVAITVFTMGPASSEAVLRRALALGADEAVLISDKAFAGSDCWATAYILSSALRSMPDKFDLILCGKQAIDGDTAQVPGEISEMLKIPMIPYVLKIIDINGNISTVSEIGDELVELVSPLPAVLTVSNGSNIRKMPSVEMTLNAFNKKITHLDSKKMGCDDKNTGLNGSHTRVVKIETVSTTGECDCYYEENLDNGFNKMLDFTGFRKRSEL